MPAGMTSEHDDTARAAYALVDNVAHGVAYPYARPPLLDHDWPRTRGSLQIAMQHSRIDAMPLAVLAMRTRLGIKL